QTSSSLSLSSEGNIITESSVIVVYLKEPLSYTQLDLYCQKTYLELFEPLLLGNGTDISITDCDNLLPNGMIASNVFQINSSNTTFLPLPISSKISFTITKIDARLDQTPASDFLNDRFLKSILQQPLADVVYQTLGYMINVPPFSIVKPIKD
ncbi:hypothetical protein, partial [Salmonella sp. s51228]|uniref:hypothetical protein n=1 Tax=Salmonella sp. s51228 TaxID=3159652 RepID=UPI00397F6C24